MKHRLSPFLFVVLASSCNWQPPHSDEGIMDISPKKDTGALNQTASIDPGLDRKDNLSPVIAVSTLEITPTQQGKAIDTRNVNPDDVIKFAETLVGTPYVYGSTDPKVGFDCSGFITYVFNNFKIKVPRSSIQFADIGNTIPIENAKPGDIVLFTNPAFDNINSTAVGHMGLIHSNEKGMINFIHSTSGKAMSVVITPLSEHYKKRFLRVGRVFPKNYN